ncbi:four helix bundle protein [Psychroflexus tropicus]|uniref:four helix bundle protein n=1 Tax=Psychroflexus tropicus TaxID=197345 RepID=UPI0003A69C2A
MKTHKNLKVWEESIHLVTEIYKQTENFPKSEGLQFQFPQILQKVPPDIHKKNSFNSYTLD